MASPVSLIYLDVDDEITSAANRIRNVTDMRVALVLPAGSRLATSRINFRLLAREAQTHAHDLFIVAPEAATRALAASAGLAVYPTVRDLEMAMELGDGGDPGSGAGASAVTAPLDAVAPPDRSRPRTGDMARPIGERPVTQVEPSSGPRGADRGADADRDAGYDRGRGGLSGRSAVADLPVVSGARRGTVRRPGWLVVVVGFVVVAFVAGFAGAQLLPAATIVVSPKVEPISLSFDVTADPTVTAPDIAAGIVPATRPEIPLTATDDFPATGKKVSETKATGTVTFSSTDTGGSNTIPSGSIVATQSNVQFVTRQTVILPPATQVGVFPNITVVPSTGNSTVTAVKPGTGGNVATGAIKIVPPDENELVIRVTNKTATSGGTHTEAAIVSQKDIDKALAALTSKLDDALEQIVTEPGQILPDVTIFAETKSRTEGVPSVDPKTLLNDQVVSFSLSMTATGSVTAVDEAAVSTLATARLRAEVATGHDLVKDSLNVTVGPGTAQGQDISFPVQASAQQVRRIVAADLRDAVRGKSLADARATLEAYGPTTIELWPGFVSSIPSLDFRIDLTVKGDVAVETGSPSPTSPGRTASPSPSATRSPGPAASGSPRPSAKPSASPAP